MHSICTVTWHTRIYLVLFMHLTKPYMPSFLCVRQSARFQQHKPGWIHILVIPTSIWVLGRSPLWRQRYAVNVHLLTLTIGCVHLNSSDGLLVFYGAVSRSLEWSGFYLEVYGTAEFGDCGVNKLCWKWHLSICFHKVLKCVSKDSLPSFQLSIVHSFRKTL